MFAREGAHVVGCDIDVRSAGETVEIARGEGLAMTSVHPCDLTLPADVQRLTSVAVQSHGGLDTLVNAGGFGAFAWIEEMDYERDWKKTLCGELDVVFLACKAA